MNGLMPDWIPEFDLSALTQIAILYVVIYAVLRRARGSRFGQALMGVGILAVLLFAFTYLFQFDVLSQIVKFILIYLAISSVVIFQPEIRRTLAAVGAFGSFERAKYGADGSATPELVLSTLLKLSDARTGVLMAFERGISLRSYEQTGVQIDAIFSRELLTSIFTPPLPLHDGGITIRNGRIAAAHCIFPVSNRPDLIANGMRHRAAVGLAEETDAFVVAVSEESGRISVAHNGKLFRYGHSEQDVAMLRRWLSRAIQSDRAGGGWVTRLLFGLHERLNARRNARPEAAVGTAALHSGSQFRPDPKLQPTSGVKGVPA